MMMVESNLPDSGSQIPTIEGYKILHQLGKGGVATVYAAEDLKNNRKVAIKVPLSGVRKEKLDNFFLEASRVTALGVNPFTVPIYDFNAEHHPPYIVMGWMEGGSLRQKLNEEAPLSIEETIPILERIASAIDYTHEHQILHLDVNPTNIMFDKKGVAYLGDYGCASLKGYGQPQDGDSAKPPGNRNYIPPEQAANLAEEASDRYALALVAYEMLTNSLAVIRYVDEKPDLLATSEIYGTVLDVLIKGFSNDPDKRYPTAAAFVEALRKAVEEQQAGTLDRSVAPPFDGGETEEPAYKRKKRLVLLGVFVLAAAAALAGYWLWLGGYFSVGEEERDTFLPAGFRCERTVAYAYKENGDYDIFIKNIDSGDIQRISENSRADRNPAWSPGGEMLAYQSFIGNRTEIVVYSFESGEEIVLTENLSGVDSCISPTWSPDGTQIVFSGRESGHWDLYIVKLEDMEPAKLTDTSLDDELDPNWSWADNRLVFQTNAEGYVHLYELDMVTKTPEEISLSEKDLQPREPVWSPDGSQIVFSFLGSDGAKDIKIAARAGRVWETASLTEESYRKETPSWSPDGESILFVSNGIEEGGNWDVYVFQIKEKQIENITRGLTGTASEPAWCLPVVGP